MGRFPIDFKLAVLKIMPHFSCSCGINHSARLNGVEGKVIFGYDIRKNTDFIERVRYIWTEFQTI